MSIVEVRGGASPLMLGMPHVGTMLPPEVTVALNDLGRAVPDTDWWLDGRPRDNVHAVQMELAQSAYMREEPPWTYLPDKAEHLADTLRAILSAILDAAANPPKP
jgi:N-formylglutamate amidohydrolase